MTKLNKNYTVLFVLISLCLLGVGMICLLSKDNLTSDGYHQYVFVDTVYGTPNDKIGADIYITGKQRRSTGGTQGVGHAKISRDGTPSTTSWVADWDFSNANNGDKIFVLDGVQNYMDGLSAGTIVVRYCLNYDYNYLEKSATFTMKAGGEDDGNIGETIHNRGKTVNEYYHLDLYYKIFCNLNASGGSGGNSSVIYDTYQQSMYLYSPGYVDTITTPTRTGYTFQGFYTGQNGSGTRAIDSSGRWTWSRVSCYPTTLYAYWTANTYTVSFSSNSVISAATPSL